MVGRTAGTRDMFFLPEHIGPLARHGEDFPRWTSLAAQFSYGLSECQ